MSFVKIGKQSGIPEYVLVAMIVKFEDTSVDKVKCKDKGGESLVLEDATALETRVREVTFRSLQAVTDGCSWRTWVVQTEEIYTGIYIYAWFYDWMVVRGLDRRMRET